MDTEQELPLSEVNFRFRDLNVYSAYKVLREEAPVWKDPILESTSQRYDDIKDVLIDTETFRNQRKFRARTNTRFSIHKLYEEKAGPSSYTGWTRRPRTQRDESFIHTFTSPKIKQLDPFVENLATRLFEEFLPKGECDWVKEFAIPLPLIVIGHQMGVPEEDIWQIKAWTDAWVQRLGMMQTDEEAIWSTEMEIEAQHYFQPIFDRLRQQPDDTLLSDLVNTEIPEWGRTLTDEELHAEMMADTFVGGSETSTNAMRQESCF